MNRLIPLHIGGVGGIGATALRCAAGYGAAVPPASPETPASLGTPASPQASNTCSAASLSARETAVGTAAAATAWVGLEQPGPWGRDALTESRLPPEVARRFVAEVSAAGARPTMLRHPGAHPDVPGPRTVLVAVGGRSPWLLQAVAPDPAALAHLDLSGLGDAIQHGPRPLAEQLTAVGFDTRLREDRILLVCTHARRDRCCAVLGRPIVDQLRSIRSDSVWEASHTGGHRFAPTGVVLPDGLVLGRLTADLALDLLDAPPTQLPVAVLDPQVWRGHSSLTSAQQVVELHARLASGDTRAGAYQPGTAEPDQVGVVDHDGSTWTARVDTVTSGLDRPPSCGATPEPLAHPRISDLTAHQ